MITKPQDPTVLRVFAEDHRRMLLNKDHAGRSLDWRFKTEEKGEIFERCAALEELVTAIEAKQDANGDWMLPFYIADGKCLMRPVAEWISTRKKAAEMLARVERGEMQT